MENLVKSILEKENIGYKEIKKATSGFTNVVFLVDDVVVKLTNDEEIKVQLKKEVEFYKNVKIQNIPQYISNGSFEDWDYLIITKVKGKPLYSIWYTLDNKTREEVVRQIAAIIKNFHKQNADFLLNKIDDWSEYIKSLLLKRMEDLKCMGYDVEFLNMFIEERVEKLFKTNHFGLVYNDAHFDNFLYDNGKVNLIDFDRVQYFPLDYEMLIFKTMCDNPLKFASEEDENIVFEKDFEKVYEQFKENYPELFEIENIEQRIKVYQFNYLIKQAIGINKDDWIKQLLRDFENDFKDGLSV